MQTTKQRNSWSHAVWSQQIYTTTPFRMSLEMGMFVCARVFVYHTLLLCICKVTTWQSGRRKITSCILWCSLFSIYGECKDIKHKYTCPLTHSQLNSSLEHININVPSLSHTHKQAIKHTHMHTANTVHHIYTFVRITHTAWDLSRFGTYCWVCHNQISSFYL